MAHVWDWYMDLRASKGASGMGGPDPIGYTDIDAWSRLTGATPLPHEIWLIRELDKTITAAMAEGKNG